MRKQRKAIAFGLLSMMTLGVLTPVQASTNVGLEMKMLAVGEKLSMNTSSTTKVKYQWSSSNKKIATVNQNGVVTAKKVGTVKITKRYKKNNKVRTTTTTLRVVSLKKGSTKTIVAGETSQLSIKKYKGATYRWTTSKKSVATVNKSGVVSAKAKGTTVIRCYVKAGSKSYISQYTVKVNTEKKVATQAQLTAALKNKKITSLVVETTKDVDFTIPKGSYKTVALSINAPNADVKNYGIFKSIKISTIKPNTWYERANGNKITIQASKARVVVSTGARVSNIDFTKKSANVSMHVNGSVDKVNITQSNSMAVKINGTVKSIYVNAAAKVNLDGSTKDKVNVIASDKAKGAALNTSVKVGVQTKAAMSIDLDKGAEGSSIKVSSDKVNVQVQNDTSSTVTVQKPSGSEQIESSQNTTPETPDNSQTNAQESGLEIVSVESVENGKVRLKLNKSYPQLTQDMLSIICTTGGSDMTILKLVPSDNYQTFDIMTSYYDDNGYDLAIIFPDKSLISKAFVSKYDCPTLSSFSVSRTSETEATVTYISDEPGHFYYLVKEEVPALATTRAAHEVPNELDGIAEADMKANGTKVEMKSKANELKITGLTKDSAYTVYYMAESQDNKTTLIKKVTIDSQVVAGDTSDISIESVEGYYKYVSFFGENYRYEITLSEPTKEALTLENFKISCPADGNMSLGRVVTTDNQHYTIYMKVGSIPKGNNMFTVTISFPNGGEAKKTFYADFDAPTIITTSSSVERTGEKELKVTLKSDEEGSIYWTILQVSDEFDPDSIAAKDPQVIMNANPTEQTLVSGTGTFTLDLDSVPAANSYLCFVTKDTKGNQSDTFYYLEIPEYTGSEDEGSAEEQKTFEISSVKVSKAFIPGVYDFSSTLTEAIHLNQEGTKIVVKNNANGIEKNFELPNKYISAGSNYYQINSSFDSGASYTITITLPDGRVGTAICTIP